MNDQMPDDSQTTALESRAIEAAARAMFERDQPGEDWATTTRTVYLGRATAAVTAAAPILEVGTVPDPAHRRGTDWLLALGQRYEDFGWPSEVEVDDYPRRFGLVCDFVIQLLWAEQFGAEIDDETLHTSDIARGIAHVIMDLVGLREAPESNDEERRWLSDEEFLKLFSNPPDPLPHRRGDVADE